MVTSFIVRRLLYLIPVGFGVLLITFVIMRVMPANPIDLLVPLGEATPEGINQVIAELGLDKPLPVQFAYYLRDVFRGDFGMSYMTRNPVSQDIAQRFPATMELTIAAMTIAIVIGIPMGVAGAAARNRWPDQVTRVIALLGVATPPFWLGIMLVFVLFYLLRWFPAPMGRVELGVYVQSITGFFTVDTLLKGDLSAFRAVILSLTLPAMALGANAIATLARLTRSAMVDVLQCDYIRTARAMGFSERVVMYRYALKNALITPLTDIGNRFGHLLGGAVLIETIFAWPGMGIYSISAVKMGDFAPVQLFIVVTAAVRVLIFIVVDIVHRIIDPRVK